MTLSEIKKSMVAEAHSWSGHEVLNRIYIWLSPNGYVSSQDGQPIDSDFFCIKATALLHGFDQFEHEELAEFVEACGLALPNELTEKLPHQLKQAGTSFAECPGSAMSSRPKALPLPGVRAKASARHVHDCGG